MKDSDGFRPLYNVGLEEETPEEYEASLAEMNHRNEETSKQYANASRMNDLGHGWSYRREKSKDKSTGERDHIQVKH